MPHRLIQCLLLFSLFASGLFAALGKHNLSTSFGGDNGEICVYCHTPHAANVKFDAPLWNKASTDTVFTMYGAAASGVAGSTLAGNPTDPTPSGATLACLSCHDGVSAINSVVNAPGSGNYYPGGTIIGNDSYLPQNMTDPLKAVGLGGDLTNDHPVSITYVEGSASLKPISTPLVGWNGGSQISDILRNGKVQCVSCHDPHFQKWGTFLRASNASSALCFSCHNK